MKNETLNWTAKTQGLVKDLHAELLLSNMNWHKHKTNKSRRAAELLISALSQIVHDGKDSDR